MERLSTGVKGLDEKMQGGLFEGSVSLVTGKTGTAKTAFCASFLYQGARQGESGVYVTTEEREEDIIDDIREMFGWDFKSLEDKNLIRILSVKPIFPTEEVEELNRLVKGYISDLLEKIEKNIEEIRAKRIVIDSVSLIEMFVQNEYIARVVLSSLIDKLKKKGITSLVVGTIPETSEGLSGGGIIEYLVDGILKLDFTPVAEEYDRTLTIRKMRRTDHSTNIHPFRIAKDGLKLVEI